MKIAFNGKYPGIYHNGSSGYQVRVKVRGELDLTQFPKTATIKEMTDWQDVARGNLKKILGDRPTSGSFAADVARYLAHPDVKHLTTFEQRDQHLTEWVAVFGTKSRRKITPVMIAQQRDLLATTPRANGQPYSPNSVNKRLRALSNVWTILDGPRAYNPVDEVAECEEPEAEARGLDFDVVEAILAEIPDTAIGVKKDGTRTTGKNVARPSKTKARLRVIAYTGLPHSSLKRLNPSDIDLDAATVRVLARKKGKKFRRAAAKPTATVLPLIPEAVDAFRVFVDLNCFGDFSNSSMWKAFQKAATRIGLEHLRPYDFRHSYLSVFFDQTRDRRTTGIVGGHRSELTTDRYTKCMVAPHVAEASAKVAAYFAARKAR